jgi:alkylhydroperoxidase family enzyme
VQAVLDDYETAPIGAPLRATLAFLKQLTLHPDAVTPDDLLPLREAGVSDQAIVDAVLVCALFSIMDRLADSFDFALQSDRGWRSSADMLLKRGYRM